MKGLVFKSLVVVLLVFFVGNYLIYLKTGQLPLRDLSESLGSDWLVDVRELLSPEQLAVDAKGAMQSVVDRVSVSDAPAPVTVYKWTDENGQVHFSDKPVANGAAQVDIELRNAIADPDGAVTQTASPSAAAPKSVSESALDKARAAAEAMKQRAQQQEQVQ